LKNLSRLLLLGAMSCGLNDVVLATEVTDEGVNHQKFNNSLLSSEENVALPTEIIIHIASFGRIREGYSMEVVSKTWNKAFQQDAIWQHYAKRIPGYIRAQEESQTENPQSHANSRRILQKLLMPKVYKLPSEEDEISHINAISEDGRTMTGNAFGRKLFVFKEKEGIDYDFTLNPGEGSAALGMSTDGKAIVGFVKNSINRNKEAFIKIGNAPKTILAPLNGGRLSYAVGVSDDYKTVAGIALEGFNQRPKAVVWKVDSGAQLTLDNFIGADKRSQVIGISKNGQFVAGTMLNPKTKKQDGFVWDLENNLMSYLNTHKGSISAISASGEKVAGVARNLETKRDESFIYDIPNHQVQFLGTLNDGHHSEVTGLSADGKVAVGYSFDGSKKQEEDTIEHITEDPTPDTHASFIYYGNGIGMQPVEKLLNGQLLEEKYPFAHLKVSGNGTIITHGEFLGWYAYIPRYDILEEQGFRLLEHNAHPNNQVG